MAGVLAFSEEGYYLSATNSDRFRRLPRSLEEELVKATRIFSIAIGTNSNFFCAWKGSDGKMWRWFNLANYPALRDYLQNETNKAKFNKEAFYCSLGPDGQFYINNSGSGQYKQLNDSNLERELATRLDANGCWIHDPVKVALGVGGSYVVVGKKGDVFWDLKGQYGGLDKLLKEAQFGVATVTLSPFNGQHWYLLNTNNDAWWGKLETGWNLQRI